MGSVRICKQTRCIVVCVGRLVPRTSVVSRECVLAKKAWDGRVIRVQRGRKEEASARAASRIANKASGRRVWAKCCPLRRSRKIGWTITAMAKSTKSCRKKGES